MLDVATTDNGLFLNVAHIGLGTLPVRESSADAKRLLGRFSYGVALLQKLRVYRGFHGLIETEKGTVAGRCSPQKPDRVDHHPFAPNGHHGWGHRRRYTTSCSMQASLPEGHL